MMILSGTEVAATLRAELHNTIVETKLSPGLAVVLIGNHPSSLAYIAQKRRAAEKVGIRFYLHALPATVSENEVLPIIHSLNSDERVDGILVQLPLPPHLSSDRILQAVVPEKDVDGFHPLNLGKLMMGLDEGFIPCTPLGIKRLLDSYALSVEGKSVVIVGRSTIVGKPLAALLMQNKPGYNATVTVTHSHTPHLSAHTRQADILVVAIGRPHFLTADMVKEGAIVIDVGINQEAGRLIGDVDFATVKTKAAAITPVPGGVGPMTVCMLLHNTLLSCQRRHGIA